MKKLSFIFLIIFSIIAIDACGYSEPKSSEEDGVSEKNITQQVNKTSTPQNIATNTETPENEKISSPAVEGTFIEYTNDAIIDSRTNLIWAKDSKVSMSWEDGLNYCEELIIQDKANWRMPTLVELQDLFNNQDFDYMVNLFNLEKCTLWGLDENSDAGFFALCGLNSLPETENETTLSRVLAVHDDE